MIGDWVYSSFYNHAVRITELYQNEYGYGFVKTDEKDDCIRSDASLSPIPLTEEILEKNGFVNVYRGRYRFDDNKGSIVVVSTVNNEIKWVRMSKYDEDIDEQLSNFNFNYMHFVHELQHSLKHCSIEKEIVL